MDFLLKLLSLQNVLIYRSPTFHKACAQIQLENWHFVTGAILHNRLCPGFHKVGQVFIGSCLPTILYEWIRAQGVKPDYKVRWYNQTICNKQEKVAREYFSWGMRHFSKQSLVSGNEKPDVIYFPFLEPKSWFEAYHKPLSDGRRMKSCYMWIQFIFRPLDHRVWCNFRQLTLQEYEKDKWTETS
jgi:hypothetical protein